jgi:hypothetical protein
VTYLLFFFIFDVMNYILWGFMMDEYLELRGSSVLLSDIMNEGLKGIAKVFLCHKLMEIENILNCKSKLFL